MFTGSQRCRIALLRQEDLMLATKILWHDTWAGNHLLRSNKKGLERICADNALLELPCILRISHPPAKGSYFYRSSTILELFCGEVCHGQ